jgi:hypothetical protein
MWHVKDVTSKIHRFVLRGLLLFCLLIAGSTASLTQERPKPQKIDATAMGTSTQLGQNVQVTLYIYDYSTEGDRQILIEAFEKGKNQGLVNALERMKAVGRIAISGTIGYLGVKSSAQQMGFDRADIARDVRWQFLDSA